MRGTGQFLNLIIASNQIELATTELFISTRNQAGIYCGAS